MEKLSFKFSHNHDFWIEGYDTYIRLYRRKRQIVFTVLFVVLAAMFIEQIIVDPEYGMGWLCLGISLFIILVNWLNPVFERKHVIAALEEIKNDSYVFRLYEHNYSVETILPQSDGEQISDGEDSDDASYSKIPKTVTELDDKSLKAVEKEEYFGLFSAKTMCIIPKADLLPSDCEMVSQLVKKINNK